MGEERQRVIVVLEGVLADVTQLLARILELHPGVVDFKLLTPCDLAQYNLCPLAAVVDHHHPSHPAHS